MNVVERAKKLILNPKKEWEVIKPETATIVGLFKDYVAPMAALPVIAIFIGYSLIGIPSIGGGYRLPISKSFSYAVVMYILSLLGTFLLGVIIDALAPSFGSKKDQLASMKVAIYSLTAAWVAGIANIIPALYIVSAIGGLYSLYMMYIGMKMLKEVPEDKMMGYFIVTIVAVIVLYIVIGAIAGAVVMGSFRGPAGFGGFPG